MSKTTIPCVATTLALACVLGASGLSDGEKERFLLEAKIVDSRELDMGVTGSRQLTLSDGRLTHHAHFQDVDEHHLILKTEKVREFNFRDSYRYNVAAYRLDRLLGLGMTPVSVERRCSGRPGAVTWWIDDVLMLEADRWRDKIEPPDTRTWNHQVYQSRLFNELVYNTDANVGNMVIDKDWSLWLIDFTRSFRTNKQLRKPGALTNQVDKRIWEALQRLDEGSLRQAMDGVLMKGEIRGVIGRRNAIVARLEERIAREGEAAVICSMPGH